MKLVVAAIADSPFKYLFSHSSHMDHETCDRRFLRKSGMSITASWGELRLTDLGQLVDKLQRQRRKLFQWQRLTGDLHMEHRSTNLKISPLEKDRARSGRRERTIPSPSPVSDPAGDPGTRLLRPPPHPSEIYRLAWLNHAFRAAQRGGLHLGGQAAGEPLPDGVRRER
jgi:hypothetical protein